MIKLLLGLNCTYLFLLSLALTMTGPNVSINISAAPSLSRILGREGGGGLKCVINWTLDSLVH